MKKINMSTNKRHMYIKERFIVFIPVYKYSFSFPPVRKIRRKLLKIPLIKINVITIIVIFKLKLIEQKKNIISPKKFIDKGNPILNIHKINHNAVIYKMFFNDPFRFCKERVERLLYTSPRNKNIRGLIIP